jgi:phosphopantothenoylcysteine synthetase/decarboxylase
VGFNLSISASGRPQTHTLDRAAAGVGCDCYYTEKKNMNDDDDDDDDEEKEEEEEEEEDNAVQRAREQYKFYSVDQFLYMSQ